MVLRLDRFSGIQRIEELPSEGELTQPATLDRVNLGDYVDVVVVGLDEAIWIDEDPD